LRRHWLVRNGPETQQRQTNHDEPYDSRHNHGALQDEASTLPYPGAHAKTVLWIGKDWFARVGRDRAHDTAALKFVVADDKAGGLFLDGPGRWEAAGGHSGLRDTFTAKPLAQLTNGFALFP
jgi:hypothetical protein